MPWPAPYGAQEPDKPGISYFKETEGKVQFSDILVYAEGRMFSRWIDAIKSAGGVGGTRDSQNGGATDPGYDEGDLINNPVYIIESLYRDERMVERDLILTAVISSNTFYVQGLRSTSDNYYNDAIIYNVTRDETDYISDYTYVGVYKRINTSSAHAGWGEADLVYITNITGDRTIDVNSFDLIGNTSNGLRKAWTFNRSIGYKQNFEQIIDQLCRESHLIKFESYDKIKLVALDTGTSAGTWTLPAYDRSEKKYKFYSKLTSLRSVFTSYKLKYDYDYGQGVYKSELFVNGSGSTAGATGVDTTALSTVEANCASALSNYNFYQEFNYSCDWISDSATATSLLIKLVQWFSKRRLFVTWYGDIKTYIAYELGDQVVINNTKLIPTGINNSSKFMIMDKQIDPLNYQIKFDLMEMG